MAAPLPLKDAPAPSGPARTLEPGPSGPALAERRALSILAFAALAAMLWVVLPVVLGILLGALIAFTLQPLYDNIANRTRRPVLAAVLCVLVSALGSVSVVAALISLFILRGAVVARALMVTLSSGGAARIYAERFALRRGPFQLRPEELTSRLHDLAAALELRAASLASNVASTTFNALLGLLFAMMTLYYVLRNWTAIAHHAEVMLPIRPYHTRALLKEFQRVGRATLLGTVVTGFAQGGFAALGFWITGVPEALFLGAATAVASLFPGVGTLIVLVPAGVFLFVTGHPTRGLLELAWGLLVVVGFCTYVIRPRLVGGKGPTPAFLTLAALMGGVAVFGLAGLIFGPLIVSVSFAILGLFVLDAKELKELSR